MTSPWTSLLPATPADSLPAPEATVLIPLPTLGLITLSGPESMKFLQGQTTTDFREVEKGHVLPGAICSLKGRVLFSFIAVPQGADASLVLPVDQLEATLAHLKKFAVFSKTQLSDASPARALLGVAGPEAAAVLQALGMEAPAPGQVRPGPSGEWAARLFEESRFLLALPVARLAKVWSTLQARWPVVSEQAWWGADIQAGLATVFAATRDRFQPQELNYQALEAVSYNKGCYTGQEVVARLYFRGKLKQRLYRLQAEVEVAEVATITAADGAAVGEVVMMAGGAGVTALLAVVRNTAAREGSLRLGEAGPALAVLPLPYALPADKEE